MERMRVAVIGAGRLGGFHAKKIAAMKNAELVAVVDPSQPARERVAADCAVDVEHQIATMANCEELLAQGTSERPFVDAAIVAVPATFHTEVAMRLLERGVHCLVEKPLTPTYREATQLVQTARVNHLVLAVGHIEQFNPAWVVLRERLRAPRYIFCRRTSDYTFRSTDVGVVLDLMIHDLELVQRFVGRPMERVTSQGWSVVGGCEDVACATITFDNGCTAVFEASRVRPESERRMEVWCENQLATLDFATRRFTFAQRSQALQRQNFNLATLPEDQNSIRDQLYAEHLHRDSDSFEAIDALAAEDRDFLNAIREHREPQTPGESGAKAIQFAENVLRNMRR